MSADEMFEELGFTKVKDDDKCIKYNNFRREIFGDKIDFDLIYKNVKVSRKTPQFNVTIRRVSGKELEAIYTKAKELGWLTNNQSEKVRDY